MVQLIVSQSCCFKAAKSFKKSTIFKHSKLSPSMPRVAEHVTSNSVSHPFHSTSENCETDFKRWFLLNGKRPTNWMPVFRRLWGNFRATASVRFQLKERQVTAVKSLLLRHSCPTSHRVRKKFTTVFVDTRLWKTKHPRKRLQNFRQSYVLSTYRIEIHQSQPASLT